jgi:subtilisin family serine protease
MKRLFALLTVVAMSTVVVPQPAWATQVRAVTWGRRVASAAVTSQGTPSFHAPVATDLTREFTALGTSGAGAMPVQGAWIVGLNRASKTGQAAVAQQAESLGAVVETRSPAGDALVVSPGPGVAGAAVVGSLRDAPGVRYVEPVVARHISEGFTATDAILGAHPQTAVPPGGVRVSLIPTDPGYAGQWGLPRIGAPAAWGVTEGSAAVKIAIVDTGVDYNQPDLAGRIDTADARNFTVSPATSNADDDSWRGDGEGHGTHVAGIAAAAINNGYAGAGVAPGCTILPVKVFDRDGNGDSYKAGLGVRWAADHGASVINMSYSGSTYTQFEADAISYALGKGCVLVAAAGNNGDSLDYALPEYPAAFPGVIGVSALTQSDAVAWFSNSGGQVDLTAPGTDIVSLAPVQSGFETTSLSGTSMAAPFVAGSAALVRSKTPTMTGVATAQQLVDTAESLGAAGWNADSGAGVVRADLALTSRPVTRTVAYPDLGGSDRYETAVKISRKAFPGGAGSVLIATGDNYPDALGSSALAGAYRAPILLVPTKGAVPRIVLDEIRRLGSGRAVVLGGKAVVSDASAAAVKSALAGSNPHVIRLAGADRYATALVVARTTKSALGSSAWTSQAFMVTGTSFSDALAVAPLAYRAGVPVLLAPTTRAGWAAFDAAIRSSDLHISRIMIVGDEDRVPATVEQDLGAQAGVGYVGRLGAPAGLATSLLVANLGRDYGMTFDHVAFASSAKFPDGLTGGPLQGEAGSFILQVPGSSLPNDAYWELAMHRKEISEVGFLGGTAAIAPAFRRAVSSTLAR